MADKAPLIPKESESSVKHPSDPLSVDSLEAQSLLSSQSSSAEESDVPSKGQSTLLVSQKISISNPDTSSASASKSGSLEATAIDNKGGLGEFPRDQTKAEALTRKDFIKTLVRESSLPDPDIRCVDPEPKPEPKVSYFGIIFKTLSYLCQICRTYIMLGTIILMGILLYLCSSGQMEAFQYLIDFSGLALSVLFLCFTFLLIVLVVEEVKTQSKQQVLKEESDPLSAEAIAGPSTSSSDSAIRHRHRSGDE